MIQKITELRKQTEASISECKKALESTGWNIEDAKKFLGCKPAENFPDIPEGLIESYIHHNKKVGTIVEIHCETGVTARNLSLFAREICMQIAATNPEFVSERDVPQERLVAEKLKYAEKLLHSGKDKESAAKIVKGKMKRFYFDHCLMNQKYVQDTRLTIRDFVNNKIRETGEKIKIVRFQRFQIGK